MSDWIIKSEGLGKRYSIKHQAERQRYVALRDVIAEKFMAPMGWLGSLEKNHELTESQRLAAGSPDFVLGPSASEDFWALKDVSFDIKPGEVVGIIGRNGAGKSTLLKILSRITEPTEGRVELRGRVASLLEVGTGFHPELTGRENIHLNGAILGMTRSEIVRKFDEIIAFAEVEKFLDTPVKRYSSGMYVRLAFAVAAHLDPEILIIDEVLAVGDAEFQKKCLGKMGEVAKMGRTVIFVSHNMGVVNALTQRVIYLQGGRVHASGNSRDIVQMYLKKALDARSFLDNRLTSYRRHRREDSIVTIIGIVVNGNCSGMLPTIEMKASFEIEVELDVEKALQGATLNLVLKTELGERAVLLFSCDQGCNLFLNPGRHTVSLRVDNLPLAPGTYFADVGITRSVEALAYDVILDFPILNVVNTGQVTHWLDRPWGVLHCDSVEWRVGS